MNIKNSLIELSQKLEAAGLENSGLEAELLVCHVLKKPREFILSYPELSLNSSQKKSLAKLAERRINHEPLAYLLGKQQFYNIDLSVNKKVLIPRPETEVLVELILKSKPEQGSTILDIGTGSGAIIIALAKNLIADYKFIATDISSKALSVAEDNAEDNGQADKIEFIKSDLLKKLLKKKTWTGSKNLIIAANLPYVESGWENIWRKELTINQIEELKQEPAIALFAGEDGFDLYRKLAEEIKSLIKKFELKVQLYCEISPSQANLFSHTFSELGTVSLERDLTGRIRMGIMKQM